jgi:hypothetical protein
MARHSGGETADRAGERLTSEQPSEIPRQRRWWPILAPLALLAVAASLLVPAARHQWALSLFRQPTHYTALSFDRPWTLPASAVTDQTLAVSFSIANHEGRAVRYRYVLSEQAIGPPQTLAQATKIVKAEATWTVRTSISLTCAASPCRVQVSLPGHPETIDFLLIMKPAPSAPVRLKAKQVARG